MQSEDTFDINLVQKPEQKICIKSILKSIEYRIFNMDIRVIPQGTFDNNQGPDRLAGPKALDPNYSRQQTL